MIHPFASFNAANTAIGHDRLRTLSETAELIDRQLLDFAAYLQSSTNPTASGDPCTSSPLSPRSMATSSDSADTDGPANPPRSRPPDAGGSDPSGPTPPRSRPPADSEPPDAGGPATPPRSRPPGSSEPPDGDPGGPDGEDPRPGPPRFADVPDSAKYPAGPYRQAPPEYGGEWWLVNPFTGEEPWLILDAPDPERPGDEFAPENLPPDFVEAFGELPVRREGEDGLDFTMRLARWKQDLEYFQQTGIPEGFDEGQVEAAGDAYEQWGMGRPVFYEGRYGWFARFPDSAIPEFEMDAASAILTSHIGIARFQVRMLQQGGDVATPHPYVPPHLLPEDQQSV